jgi:hypothetical protein
MTVYKNNLDEEMTVSRNSLLFLHLQRMIRNYSHLVWTYTQVPIYYSSITPLFLRPVATPSSTSLI